MTETGDGDLLWLSPSAGDSHKPIFNHGWVDGCFLKLEVKLKLWSEMGPVIERKGGLLKLVNIYTKCVITEPLIDIL